MDDKTKRFNPRTLNVALVLSMVFVVTSFSASLWYSHFRLERIQEDALQISRNATPAIEHLAAARSELYSVGIAANDFLMSPAKRGIAAQAETRAARAALADELARYRAIPFLAGEPQVVIPMTDELALLDAMLAAHVFERDRATMSKAERAAAFDSMSVARAKVSASFERLIALNAAAISARTSEIMAARESARASALALGMLSVVAAIVATLLVLITIRTQAKLVVARRAFLEAKATELEAFAGRVAHDLKNPLSALLLLVAGGQRKCTSDPNANQLFEKLTRRLHAMNRIIDSFLDFARGAARPHEDARSDLKEVVDDVVADMGPLADDAKTTVRVDAFPQVSVACAPGVLRSILQNLLQNAVKYIDRGPGQERKIEIHVESRAASVVVEVEDTGPGIPPEKAASIFQPFVRLLGTSNVQGLGIGLATVKRIVEAHDGRVGVRSAVGLGSLFWFELPRFDENRQPSCPEPTRRDVDLRRDVRPTA